jgi:hypothetical protein
MTPSHLVPTALDPATFARHHPRDRLTQQPAADAVVASMVAAVSVAQGAAARLIEARAALAADPTRTPEAKAVEMRRLALGAGEKHARSLDAIRARTEGTIAQLRAEAMPAPPPAPLAGEVRSRLSQLPRDERGRILEAALAAGDATIAGAALAAPPFLSGLDPAVATTLAARWAEHHAPELAARARRLEHALADLDRAGRAWLGFVAELAESAEARTGESLAVAAAGAIRAAEAAAPSEVDA